MTDSNFKELWIAIWDNGKILTCWCCSHIIPCLYEKEYTDARMDTLTSPALLLLEPGIKAQKKK